VKERTRVGLGAGAVAAGIGLVAIGVLVAHFTGLPETDSVGRELYPSIPRHWSLVALGQLTGLAGSQLIVGGIVFAFLYGRTLTWARAAVGAALFALEAMLFFAIVPHQMLVLFQGEFAWTPQKIAFTIPRWLVLNNDVSISYALIKDLIVAGYATTMLGVVAVGMYQWQERQKKKAGPAPQRTSGYGRPLVKGDRR
jgi:hypothetical protein